MNPNVKSDLQLYPLVSSLSTYIDHIDYTGMIVGYAIIDALSKFSTTVNSKSKNKNKRPKAETVDQLKFEEIKSVYKKLDDILAYAKENSGSLTYSNISSILNPDIGSLVAHNNPNKTNSYLLKTIVKSLAGDKNYLDTIRKNGIQLVDLIKRKGSYSRRIDYLTEDYKSIASCFGRNVR